MRIYYRGPLQWGGDPRAIWIDMTRDEKVILPPVKHQLIHPYSDSSRIVQDKITCYSLVEVLAEKIRAVGIQRRFAISRDVHDIHQLIQTGVSLEDVTSLLPDKFEARDLDVNDLDIQKIQVRRRMFENDWANRLSYLVRQEQTVDFEIAWGTTLETFQQIKKNLDKLNLGSSKV